MNFQPSELKSDLSNLPAGTRLRVALSGGLDSVVLLHALVALRDSSQLDHTLDAIHINHHINPKADDWQQHCESLCHQHEIPLTVRHLALDSEKSGLEERAREGRYQAFAELMEMDDCLLQAHHLDDQMETLMLRLLRGSGPGGLTGMPVSRQVGRGQLLRPLLSFTRRELADYAALHKLVWQEDDSNADVSFDRNFCRHQLLPLIETRWPDYRERFTKTRQLWSESEQLLQQLAKLDFDRLKTGQPSVIELQALLDWDAARQRNVLRYWLNQIAFPDINWNLLQRLAGEVITAAPDRPACIAWQGGKLQRFRQRLYALRDVMDWSGNTIEWSASSLNTVALPGNGSLEYRPADASLPQAMEQSLSVTYRSGGESCRLPGRPNKTLKQLLQENAVEPWLRDRYPILRINGQLAALPDLGINQDGPLAGLGQTNHFHWHKPDLSWQPN